MDGVTLDCLLGELRPWLVGRHLLKPRLAAPHAFCFAVSGAGDQRLWLDAERGSAGLYWLSREQARALEDAPGDRPGRSRQALLLFRKHLAGRRVTSVSRIRGERTLLLEAGSAMLVLRLSGSAPAATLAVDGRPLATAGEGAAAWPPPAAAPEREWSQLTIEALARIASRASAEGRPLQRALLAEFPSLGPLLARRLDGSASALADLRAGLDAPQALLVAPAPLESVADAELVGAGAVVLTPIPIPGRATLHPGSWREAAALFLVARRRAMRFQARQRQQLDAVRHTIRRLCQLQVHLERDLTGLADPPLLRRQAEALLTCPPGSASGATELELADPYAPDSRLLIRLDPRLTLAGNAERLFEKARRLDRARAAIEARLSETAVALASARAQEARPLSARNLSDLPQPRGAGPHSAEVSTPGGPRRYLTSNGLTLLVGRGARENHELTFGVARPEDLWLHARDVPGAHVILRDNEGRARSDDLREAAEVAAFCSEARSAAQVDVHVTRRKHVRPGRGGLGRVSVGHSETLRVTPRDPEGRLRHR